MGIRTGDKKYISIVGIIYKIAMPLIYKIIPYKGACTADDQIAVISKFIEEFGKEKIEGILGDREFYKMFIYSICNGNKNRSNWRARATDKNEENARM